VAASCAAPSSVIAGQSVRHFELKMNIGINKRRSSTNRRRGNAWPGAAAVVLGRQTDIQVFGQHLFDHVTTPITRSDITLADGARRGC